MKENSNLFSGYYYTRRRYQIGLEGGSDYLIIGRAIINSESPLNKIKNIYDSIKDLEY